MPTTNESEMRPDAAAPERLVRSRSGRLVPESELAGPPQHEPARPMHPALKAGLIALGVLVVGGSLMVVLDTREGGARASFESFFRDFGYVVREVHGPGIQR